MRSPEARDLARVARQCRRGNDLEDAQRGSYSSEHAREPLLVRLPQEPVGLVDYQERQIGEVEPGRRAKVGGEAARRGDDHVSLSPPARGDQVLGLRMEAGSTGSEGDREPHGAAQGAEDPVDLPGEVPGGHYHEAADAPGGAGGGGGRVHAGDAMDEREGVREGLTAARRCADGEVVPVREPPAEVLPDSGLDGEQLADA